MATRKTKTIRKTKTTKEKKVLEKPKKAASGTAQPKKRGRPPKDPYKTGPKFKSTK